MGYLIVYLVGILLGFAIDRTFKSLRHYREIGRLQEEIDELIVQRYQLKFIIGGFLNMEIVINNLVEAKQLIRFLIDFNPDISEQAISYLASKLIDHIGGCKQVLTPYLRESFAVKDWLHSYYMLLDIKGKSEKI